METTLENKKKMQQILQKVFPRGRTKLRKEEPKAQE
jgi:hypothetical protein